MLNGSRDTGGIWKNAEQKPLVSPAPQSSSFDCNRRKRA